MIVYICVSNITFKVTIDFWRSVQLVNLSCTYIGIHLIRPLLLADHFSIQSILEPSTRNETVSVLAACY